MADDKNDIKFSLKAMVNKKKGKVLFVEVDGTFADVLINFLTLPLGSIVEFLRFNFFPYTKFGSVTTLYTGLQSLDSAHFLKEYAKSILLLRPRTSSNAEPNITFSSLFQRKANGDGDFMKPMSSFLITDDLHLMPNAGLLQVARVVGVTDMDGAETMNVSFGSNEVSKLLVYSLTSMNPLSMIILGANPESNKETQFITNASNSKGMNLKLMVQKSTNKLLYAEAEEDFVDFLFSFLMIPLGGVESLLSSNSNVKAIDNLHKSVEELIPDKYFNNLDAKNRVLKPTIPHGYVSKNHIFPLITQDKLPVSTDSGQGSYLKGPRIYKINDDLSVTPFCIVSIIGSLSKEKVPLSDVKEVEVQIGLKEGLSILKTSLTSKCALTDALLSPILNRKRKR